MQAIHSLGPLLCIKPGVETPASMIDPETQEPSINPQEGTSETGQRRTQMTTGVTESLGTSETVAPRQRRTQITVPRMEMHDYLPQRYNIIDILCFLPISGASCLYWASAVQADRIKYWTIAKNV